jgi:hypothetical protein
MVLSGSTVLRVTSYRFGFECFLTAYLEDNDPISFDDV